MGEERDIKPRQSVFEKLERGNLLEWGDIINTVLTEGRSLGLRPDAGAMKELVAGRQLYFGRGIWLEKLVDSVRRWKGDGWLEWGGEGKKRPKGMIIATEPSLRRFGIEAGLKELRPLFGEASFTRFTNFPPEPGSNIVAEVAIKAYLAGVDFLVAIGGGSSLDLAKATNVCLCDSQIGKSLKMLDRDSTDEEKSEVGRFIIGRLSVYLSGEINRELSWDKIRADLPLVAIPTTAGTGSEVTSFAVVNDSGKVNERKSFMLALAMKPDVVILDPTLTLSLPENQTVWTGLDAMVHAVEAFIGRRSEGDVPGSTQETLALAGWALKLIGGSLGGVKEDGQDLQGRSRMQLASFLAGLSFENSHLGPVHDLGEPLGHEYRLVHGESLVRVLIPVLRRHIFIARHEGRFGEVSSDYQTDVKVTVDRIKQGIEILLNIQTEGVESAVRGLGKFLKGLGAKTDLTDLGLGELEIMGVVEKTGFTGMTDEEHPNLYDVPYWTKEDYIEVMKEAAGLD